MRLKIKSDDGTLGYQSNDIGERANAKHRLLPVRSDGLPK